MCCEPPQELRMRGGEKNVRTRKEGILRSAAEGENSQPPLLQFASTLDLHKSSNSPVSQSSQAANAEVKGQDGCDEIFLQPKSEAGRETAELNTFIRS